MSPKSSIERSAYGLTKSAGMLTLSAVHLVTAALARVALELNSVLKPSGNLACEKKSNRRNQLIYICCVHQTLNRDMNSHSRVREYVKRERERERERFHYRAAIEESLHIKSITRCLHKALEISRKTEAVMEIDLQSTSITRT